MLYNRKMKKTTGTKDRGKKKRPALAAWDFIAGFSVVLAVTCGCLLILNHFVGH
jgi:hypothetical protein